MPYSSYKDNPKYAASWRHMDMKDKLSELNNLDNEARADREELRESKSTMLRLTANLCEAKMRIRELEEAAEGTVNWNQQYIVF